MHWLAGLVAVLLSSHVVASTPTAHSDEPLAPEPRHEDIGQLVTQFVQKSHYLHIAVDDDLSSRVLDRYIESIDRNRVYLLASDLEFFEKYRYLLDDMVRSEPLNPVFDIFSIYRTRVRERFEYALTLLEEQPDLTIEEEYLFDRSETTWAKTPSELDELWRLRVKNDVLNLALADKPWEDSREVLRKRYARYLKRMDQLKSDDVFETCMNAFAHTLDPHSS